MVAEKPWEQLIKACTEKKLDKPDVFFTDIYRIMKELKSPQKLAEASNLVK